MADTVRRRGRPAPPLSEIDPTAPPYSRILRAGLASLGHETTRSAALACGVPERGLRVLLTGRTNDPGIATLAPILRLIRPRDADGGWGWFGRALTAAGSHPATPATSR